MKDFTLRIDKSLNDKLDDICKITGLTKSSIIIIALYLQLNHSDDFKYYYSSEERIRTTIRISEDLLAKLDDKVAILATSKNLYINAQIEHFINSFQYI